MKRLLKAQWVDIIILRLGIVEIAGTKELIDYLCTKVDAN